MEKVKVTERALIARINRKLAKQDEKLLTCRESSPSFYTLGRYYVVNIYGNYVINQDVGLDELGREMGVLKPFEEMGEK